MGALVAGRWWAGLGLCLALGGSLVVAPPASAAPVAVTDSPTVRKQLMGALEKAPALSLSGHLISPGRQGGRAIFDVVLVSTSRGGSTISGLEVRLAAPEGTRFIKLDGKGWECTKDDQVALCSHARTLDRDENPKALRSVLKIGESFAGSKAWVSGWARWDGEPRREGAWVVSERNDVPIYPKATLRVTPSAPVVTVFRNGTPQQRQFHLTAEIGRLGDQHASLTWRQVSGPKVRFLSPTDVTDVSETAEQLVQVTKTPDRQRYVFAARVVAQGQVVERRVSVMTRGGQLLGEVAAATPSEAAIAGSTDLAPLDGSAEVDSRTDLRVLGPSLARAGATVRLRAAGAERGTLRWTVDGRAAGSGRTARVAVPRTPGATSLVEVSATLPSGRSVVAGHVIVARASATRSPRNSVVPRADSAFCQIARAIDDDGTRVLPLGSKDEQRFTFRYDKTTIGSGVFDADGTCTGTGEIAITDATLVQSKDIRLSDATATLTPSGLTITAARVTVNSTASNGLTDKIGLKITGTIESRLSGNSFGIAEGSATFDPVSIDGAPPVSPFALFLDKPGDWEFLPDASHIVFGTGLSDPQAVRLTQIATSPPNAQGTRGTASLAVDLIANELARAEVSVANLTLGETPKGGLIMVESARAKIDLGAKRGFEVDLPITCSGGWESAQCEVFAGLRFSDMSLQWTTTRMSLAATAAIAFGGDKSYALTFTGTYRGDRDWEILVVNPKDWQLGKGMTFSRLRGSIESKPQGETTADVTMSITGTFSGLSLGSAAKVSEVTPRLTNECPSDAPAECSLTEMKLFLTASIEATLPGRTAPTTFDARAEVNLTTLNFRFESGTSGLDIGPEALKLKDVKLVISRGLTTDCTPQGREPETGGGISVRFIGSARVLDVNYDLNIQSDSRGLCLWGKGDDIALGGGLEAVSPVLAYTTYAEGASVDGGSDIKANQITLVGGFLFPNSLKERFGIPGEGVTFKADLATDLSQAAFQVQYNAAGDVALYRGDGAALLLEGVGFGLDLTIGEVPTVDAYFFGRARLDLEGSPSSSTPLEVRIGVSYSGAQFKVAVQGGLVTGGADNAFGVEGLTMRELSVSAAFDIVTTTPTLALNGDVTLPPGWMSEIGIADGTPIALAASLDALRPCLSFTMGTSGGADIVDFGGVGFLTANYVKLLLAPAGCTVPSGATTVDIDPGWAVAVEGRVLGSPASFAAGFTVSPRGIVLSAEIHAPLLKFYGVTLRGKTPGTSAKLTFALNTERGTFEASVNAGLEIGNVRLGRGLLVEVKGEIRKRSDYFEIDIKGNGSVRLGPVGLSFDPVEIDGTIPLPGSSTPLTMEINTSVLANLDLGALGDYAVRATGKLAMQGTTVTELAITANGTFDAKIYTVTGTIAFNLCAGTLTDATADGAGSQCTAFGASKLEASSPAIRVSAFGTEKVAFKDPKPFVKVYYDRVGVEG
jgi:hypothetical protein